MCEFSQTARFQWQAEMRVSQNEALHQIAPPAEQAIPIDDMIIRSMTPGNAKVYPCGERLQKPQSIAAKVANKAKGLRSPLCCSQGLYARPNCIGCIFGQALRVRPETSGRIAEFSEHEAD